MTSKLNDKEVSWTTSSHCDRVRRDVPAVGYHCGQFRSALSGDDLRPEILLEVIAELTEHIEILEAQVEDLEAQGGDLPSSAGSVGRKLVELGRKVRPLGRGRSLACSEAGFALQGMGKMTHDVLVLALESLVDELEERDKREGDLEEDLEGERAWARHIERLNEDMLDGVADLLGDVPAELGIDDWDSVLDRVRDMIFPAACPVPDCTEPILRVPLPAGVPGPWPVRLCRGHTVVRYEKFCDAVSAAMPDYAGPTHAAMIPLPKFAHLAPSPDALQDPPARSRSAPPRR